MINISLQKINSDFIPLIITKSIAFHSFHPFYYSRIHYLKQFCTRHLIWCWLFYDLAFHQANLIAGQISFAQLAGEKSDKNIINKMNT